VSYLFSNRSTFTPKEKGLVISSEFFESVGGPVLINPAANAVCGGNWSDFKYLPLYDDRNIPTKSINQQPAEARLDIAHCCGSETVIGVRRVELFKSQ
jgi:hypothetical protein